MIVCRKSLARSNPEQFCFHKKKKNYSMTHAQNADSFTFRGLKMSPQSFVFFFLGYLLNAHAFAQQSWQTRGELPPIAVIWQKKSVHLLVKFDMYPNEWNWRSRNQKFVLAVDQKLSWQRCHMRPKLWDHSKCDHTKKTSASFLLHWLQSQECCKGEISSTYL